MTTLGAIAIVVGFFLLLLALMAAVSAAIHATNRKEPQ